MHCTTPTHSPSVPHTTVLEQSGPITKGAIHPYNTTSPAKNGGVRDIGTPLGTDGSAVVGQTAKIRINSV